MTQLPTLEEITAVFTAGTTKNRVGKERLLNVLRGLRDSINGRTAIAPNIIADGTRSGGTDAAAAINNALSSISTSGGKVVLRPGSYWLDRTIQIPSNTVLEGLAAGDGVRLYSKGITAIQSPSGNQLCAIKNLRLYSNKTPHTWGVEVDNNQRGIFIEEVYCDSFGENENGGGFRIDSSWGSLLMRIKAERCGYGVRLYGAAVQLINPILRQNSGPGLFIDGGRAYEIVGGVIEKTRSQHGAVGDIGYSVIVTNANQIGFDGLYAERSRRGIIKVENSGTVTFKNCYIDGIDDGLLNYGLVTFLNATHCGLMFCDIRGLHTNLGPGKACVWIDEKSTFITLIGNRFERDGVLGAGNFAVVDLGENTTMLGNSDPTDSTNGLSVRDQSIRADNVHAMGVNLGTTTNAPPNPQEGEIRYADGTAWDPIGGGARGWVGYNGATWTLIKSST